MNALIHEVEQIHNYQDTFSSSALAIYEGQGLLVHNLSTVFFKAIRVTPPGLELTYGGSMTLAVRQLWVGRHPHGASLQQQEDKTHPSRSPGETEQTGSSNAKPSVSLVPCPPVTCPL